jgi:hypothetical protein
MPVVEFERRSVLNESVLPSPDRVGNKMILIQAANERQTLPIAANAMIDNHLGVLKKVSTKSAIISDYLSRISTRKSFGGQNIDPHSVCRCHFAFICGNWRSFAVFFVC